MKKKAKFETDFPSGEIDFSKVFQDVLYHYQVVRSISIQEKDSTSFRISFQNPVYGLYCMRIEEDLIVGLVGSGHHRHICSNDNMTAAEVFAETCKEIDAILAEKAVQIILYGDNNIAKKSDLYDLTEIEQVLERARKKRLFPRWQIHKVQIVSFCGTLDKMLSF